MFPYCLGTFGVMIALKMILRIVLAATYTCELLSTVSKISIIMILLLTCCSSDMVFSYQLQFYSIEQ